LGDDLFDVQPLIPAGATQDYRVVDRHVRGLRRPSICFIDAAEETPAEALWCARLASRNVGFRVVSLLYQRSYDGSFLPPFPRVDALPHPRTVSVLAEALCSVSPAHRESIQANAATLVAEIEARTMLRALGEQMIVDRSEPERHLRIVHRIDQAWHFGGVHGAKAIDFLEATR
jgi:hypothetical protein